MDVAALGRPDPHGHGEESGRPSVGSLGLGERKWRLTSVIRYPPFRIKCRRASALRSGAPRQDSRRCPDRVTLW